MKEQNDEIRCLAEKLKNLNEKLKNLKGALQDALMQETKALMAGKTCTIIHDDRIEIIFHLFWDEDDSPSFTIKEIQVKDPTYLENLLMGTFIDTRNRLKNLAWDSLISKTEPFLEWDRRIKKVCSDATAGGIGLDPIFEEARDLLAQEK